MGHIPHAFENQIFESFRMEEKKVKSAISLLKQHGYVVYKKDSQE